MAFWRRWQRRKQQYFRPLILITGAGSGIGLALAQTLYAQPQYRVLVTVRPGSLKRMAEVFAPRDGFEVAALDIRDTSSIENLVARIEREQGGVNILVNNAGISYRAVAEHMTDEDEALQMSTNYFGPMALIRRVLPGMRQSGRGKIINISSVSGMLAMPTMSSYSASKHALEGASEALWYEVKPFGVDVSLIQPGFINSNSFKNVYYTALSHPHQSLQGEYQDYYRNMIPFVEKLMRKSFSTPEQIAQVVVKVIQTENPPLWIPATLDAWFFYYLRRWVPRRFLLPLLFRLLPNAKTWASGFTHRRPEKKVAENDRRSRPRSRAS